MNTKFYFILSVFVAQLIISKQTFSQIVAGDHCSNATTLVVASSCTAVNYTSIGSTSSGAPTPTCTTPLADVWFQVTVPASGHLQIKLQNITAMTSCATIYSDSCAALTELKCYTNFSFHNINDMAFANQIIYVRVWRLNNATGGNFSICAWEPTPPSSDFCANAIPLTVGTSCVNTIYNNVGCTDDGVGAAPIPACGNYQGSDVWFKVVVPSSGHLRIEKTSLTTINAYSTYYTGTCGAMTQIACHAGNDDYNINNGAMAGQTIYIRIWDQSNANSTGGTFNLCAWEPNTPVNDTCANAVTLSVGTSCSLTSYNNFGCTAEATSVAPNPTCGLYNGGDVWFKVVVPSSGHLRIEKENGVGINAQSAIYTGTCGAMTQLICLAGNNPYNINNIAMAGQTIYIRVFDFNEGAGQGTFNLCVWEPTPPANDFCANAVSLTVGASCSFSNYNNIGCTAEATSISPNPSCGIYLGSDVWFKVVVPSSGHLRIDKQNVSGMNAMSAIYSGTCGSMTQLGCVSGNTAFNIHNHALAGQTVYIRVWDFNNAFNGGVFSICAWEPNTPENDFCANAITLPVNIVCNLDTFSIVGCTAEAVSVSPNPTCGAYAGGDIWFKVVVPTSGHLRIDKNVVSNINAQMSVYTGTCGAMTQIACASSNDEFNLHNHTMAGQTLYIRVWNFNHPSGGELFSICAWEPNIPENDFCANAIPISVGVTCIQQTYSSVGCTTESTSVAANPTCGFYNANDLWFTFDMPSSGLLNIEKTSVSPMNAQFAIYSGSCGAMTQVGCSQLQSSFTLNNNLLSGQTLYLRVWNYNSSEGGTFTLCLFDPTCLIVIDSVNTNPASCSIVSDGNLSIYATCTLCVGALEYSINNGMYQSSHIFNNISSGFYSIKVRDSGKPLCFEESASGTVVGSVIVAQTYYQDSDNDGYGKNTVSVTTCSAPPVGYVLAGGDCNDANAAIKPNALEITCNGIDENCNSNNDDTPGEINVIGKCNSILDGNLVTLTNSADGTHFGDVTLTQSVTRIFTIENTEPFSMTINNITLSGANASSFSISPFTPNTILPDNSSFNFEVTFTPTSVGTKNAVVTILNTDCNEAAYDFAIQGVGTTTNYSTLNLNLFIEGYYIGAGAMVPVLLNQGIVSCTDLCDTITVELLHATNYSVVALSKTILQTNGSAQCKFPTITGNYYVVVKHRNGLQTWSANPVSFTSVTNYNFTTANTQAFGSNQKEVESGVWAFYSGDINQEENIDLLDSGLLEDDINNFEFGYRSADINGDGNVDLIDNPLVENNINNFIFSLHP